MAFVAETQILTDSGWKSIKDIYGQDRVLVRNFIGDAEFIRPFALKKMQYDGEVFEIGCALWSFTATPEHLVVYDNQSTRYQRPIAEEYIKDLTINEDNRLHRKFKFIPDGEYKKEIINIRNNRDKKLSTVNNLDWYVLVGFILTRGYIDKAYARKYGVEIRIDKDREQQELNIVCSILDRIGLGWAIYKPPSTGLISVRIDAKNSLGKRLMNRLGSSKRKSMFIPDTMIYNANKELAKALVETIISNITRSDIIPDRSYKIASNNEKLIYSLEKLCLFWGYTTNVTVATKKGTDLGSGPATKDVLRIQITPAYKSTAPTFKNKKSYKGAVYEIDLFEGQVCTKKGQVPVWVNPK